MPYMIISTFSGLSLARVPDAKVVQGKEITYDQFHELMSDLDSLNDRVSVSKSGKITLHTKPKAT